MFIVKESPQSYMSIASAMLNFETSTKHYVDGRPYEVGTEISMDEYRGYPKLLIDGATYIIRGTNGYLYISPSTNIDKFEAGVIDALKTLENSMVDNNNNRIEVLNNYQTVRTGHQTNIKVKSSMKITRDSSQHIRATSAKNVKRLFNRKKYSDAKYRGRFTWNILPINNIDFSVNTVCTNMEDPIARLAIAIFYDSDDICKLNHGDSTFSFSLNDFLGYDNFTNQSIAIYARGDPLLIESSMHWRNYFKTSMPSCTAFHNINRDKVFECDLKLLTLKPVEAINGEFSVDICSKCASPLIGDNYVLMGNVKHPESKLGTAICALCLHAKSDLRAEDDYFRIFRVKFPGAPKDIIKDKTHSAEYRDLCTEVLKGIEKKSIVLGDCERKYVLIGTKYAAVGSIENYLFNGMCKIPDLKNRKICAVVMID